MRRDRLVAGLVGEMNEDRKLIVRKVSLSHSSPPHLFVHTMFSSLVDIYHTYLHICMSSFHALIHISFVFFSYFNVVTYLHVPEFPYRHVSIPSCLHTQVFQKLDTAKDGLVTRTSIQRFYRQDSREMEGVWFDHAHKTSLHSPITSINYAVSS